MCVCLIFGVFFQFVFCYHFFQAAIVGTVGTVGIGDIALDEVTISDEACNVQGMYLTKWFSVSVAYILL